MVHFKINGFMSFFSNQPTFLKNISYSVAGNVLSLIVSVIIVLVVPKLTGVKEYGYFQLFLFYIGYVGFFHFGWCDGLILRFAGAYYDQLDKPKIAGQFWSFVSFEFVLWLIFSVLVFSVTSSEDQTFVLVASCIGAVFILINTFLRFLLQATNRIKAYAALVSGERLLYLLLILIGLYLGKRSYQFLSVVYIVSNAAETVASTFLCRQVIFNKPETLKSIFSETRENLNVGFKLMIANIMGMLIVGSIRYAIEIQWGIEVFGKVALMLSLIAMIMVFVNSVSLVLLPTLRRVSKEKLKAIYLPARLGLMTLLLTSFLLCYPIQAIMSSWLPKYADALQYLPYLMPVCLYECTMSLLSVTYLKVLRKEKLILKGNLIGLLFGLTLSALTIFFLQSIPLAILTITVSQGFRAFLMEYFASNTLAVSSLKYYALEGVAVIFFILLSIFITGLPSKIALYTLLLLLYFSVIYKQLVQS